MLGRSELSELAAARLRLGSESTLVPEGCKSSAKVLAAMSALPGTLTGIDAQPNSAAAKDFPALGASRDMKPEAGQPTRFTVAG
jgi:hypothetical protein